MALVIGGLVSTTEPAQRSDALFAPQTGQNDPDLLLCQVVLARLAFDAPDQLVSGVFRYSGFLVHLRSTVDAMNQKSSIAQIP